MAVDLVEEFSQRLATDTLTHEWIRAHFEACDPDLVGEVLAQANLSRVSQEFALGQRLHRGVVSGSRAILGVVEGPDYHRVVLQGSPWTTVVVSGADVHRIRTVEISSCGLCEEPERFVRDLLVDVRSRGDGTHRLLPGKELYVSSLIAGVGEREAEWLAAWQARNVTAGYTRWLLHHARVAGSSGSLVELTWGKHAEEWRLLYQKGRWVLDYEALPEQSRLRLSREDLASWQDHEHVAALRAKWWLPTWRKQADKTLISRDLLYAVPRPAQGDLLVYGHDVGRRFAHLGLLDSESGEVLGSFALPTLPERVYMPLDSWRELFRFSLSPDGTLFAVAAHDRLWVIQTDTGEVLHRLQGLAGAGALAFSQDGRLLAVAEKYSGAIALLDVEQEFLRVEQARYFPANVQDLLSSEEGWLILLSDGRIRRVGMRSLLSPLEPDKRLCCGAVSAVTRRVRTGGVVVSCAEACESGILWTWEPMEHGEATALAAGGREPASGPLAVDQTGGWLVRPLPSESSAAVVVSLDGAPGQLQFGDQPLIQVQWDPTGQAVWGVDVYGRAWKWPVSRLLKQEGAGLEP